jgi:ketosteroid isomerase-like protein
MSKRIAIAIFVFGAFQASAATVDHEAVIKKFYAFYNAQGAASLKDFYTENATFTDPSFGLDLKGSQQIGQLFGAVLGKYETLEHEIQHTVQSGDELVVEGMMVATLHGKPLRVRYVSVFRFEGDKIASQRDLYDLLHYYEQLGVVPNAFKAKSNP